ncbi:MAG: hypothetical protein WCP22_02355 [Chlamydiota bacterium]
MKGPGMQKPADYSALLVRLIAVAAVALVFAPYVWGHFHEPPGMVFMGFADHPYDQNVYLSYIQQASEGKFFIRRDHTLEPQRPLFFNPFTWVMGQAVRLLRVTALQVYYAAIALYAFLLFWVIYWFISFFIADRRARVFAFALCAFSSGLCWLIPYREWLVLASRSPIEGHNLIPIDYWIAETITFETILSVPQKAATALLMLLAFGFFLKASGERTVARGIAGGLAVFALSLVHPVDVVPVAVVIAACAAVALIRFRNAAPRAAAAGALIALTALPAFLYMVYLFRTEPVFIEWSKEKFISPHPLSYVIGYGLVLFLAVPEIVWIVRRGRFPDWLPAVWAVAVAALLYAPLSYQRRLSTGVHVALCVLATRFVFRSVLPALRKIFAAGWGPRVEGAALAALVIATAPANFVKVALCIRDMRANPLEFYLPQGDVEAMRWMRGRHNEDAAVLSTYKSGLYLPAYTGNRTYVGHWSETLRFNEKARTAEWALFAPGDEAAKREFMKQQGIRYVYFGNFERMRGRFALEGAPYLEEIYKRGGVSIYRVAW